VYLLVFHAFINEMHGSKSKIPSKKSRRYIYDISRLRVKETRRYCKMKEETLDSNLWRSQFGRGNIPVIRVLHDDEQRTCHFSS
jgi:hypothetical protein